MSNGEMSLESRVSVELLSRIDAACDQFEALWRTGSAPQIQDYLALFRDEERPLLLESLENLQHELRLRFRPGENLTCDGDKRAAETSSPKNDIKERSLATYGSLNGTDSVPEAVAVPQTEYPQLQSDQSINSSTTTDALSASVAFHVIAGPHKGQKFEFSKYGTLLAGRISYAQLRLNQDLHFSRHHFRIEINLPNCLLIDLNSRSGTYVNQERIKDRCLKDGDIISGGRTRIVVRIIAPKEKSSDVHEYRAAARIASPLNRQEFDPPQVSGNHSLISEVDVPVIPGYRLFEQIGTGDLGVVFRAQRQSDGEECALKVLSRNEQADEVTLDAFLRQVAVLNRVQHPHIVRSLDMGSVGNYVYFATEYVKTLDWSHLVDRLSDEKRVRAACVLMTQILAALNFAHTRSIVHRDIKPGNILIARRVKSLSAKLADFGLAKEYTMAGMSQMTRDGDVLGSLPFMSPDQFLNSREARPTCDIYSAGATLYWMLTGHEPISMDNQVSKFLAILETPPTPIREYNSVVPESLAMIVHRALEKSPQRRFATAAEMCYQLKAFLK
jgi:serine/threonine-protein kinase